MCVHVHVNARVAFPLTSVRVGGAGRSVSGEAGAFTLMAGFPPKPLEDVGATLEAAGLLNSQVIMNML